MIDDHFIFKHHVNYAWRKTDGQNDRELEEMLFTEVESVVVDRNDWWLFYLQASSMLEAERTEWQRIEKKLFTEVENLVVDCSDWWSFYLQASRKLCLKKNRQTEWQGIGRNGVHRSWKRGSRLLWLMIILSSSIMYVWSRTDGMVENWENKVVHRSQKRDS